MESGDVLPGCHLTPIDVLTAALARCQPDYRAARPTRARGIPGRTAKCTRPDINDRILIESNTRHTVRRSYSGAYQRQFSPSIGRATRHAHSAGSASPSMTSHDAAWRCITRAAPGASAPTNTRDQPRPVWTKAADAIPLGERCTIFDEHGGERMELFRSVCVLRDRA
jgi:hypothetical protein